MKSSSEILDDAQRLLQAGAELELILAFFRERGLDKIDSINSVRTLLGKTMREAKTLVDCSRAWSDTYNSDMQLREKTIKALRQLADVKSLDIPNINLANENE